MSTSLLVAAAVGVFILVFGIVAVFWPSKPQQAARKPRQKKAAPEGVKPAATNKAVEALTEEIELDEEDITLLTVRLDLQKAGLPLETDGDSSYPPPPYEEMLVEETDEDLEPAAFAHPIVADQGAEHDVPTMTRDAFLVSAARQTDTGKRRKRNEDRYLVRHDDGIFVVADGMGGYKGGDIASGTAVDTINQAFEDREFEARVHTKLPRRARELAQAMQAANIAIWEEATDKPDLKGMGTTLVATRFALRKKRVYIGHVGDSRCYRLRSGELKQLTQDHTLESAGFKGPGASHLLRAVGINAEVEIDVIMAEPRVGDVYLLCSDGLTKMVDDRSVQDVLVASTDLEQASEQLVALANAAGGKDNVTVVLVGIRSPTPPFE